MRGWPVHRPTHAPAIVIRINRKRIPHRHSGISAARRACLPIEVPGEFFTRYPVAACVQSRACERISPRRHSGIFSRDGKYPESPAQRAGAPPPPQLLSVRPNNAHHQPKLLVQPLPRRHAWLAGPPANTCSRNSHQNKPQKNPPSSFRNLRRKAGLLSHRNSGRILHTLSRGGMRV